MIIRIKKDENNLIGARIEPLFELFSTRSIFFDVVEKASGESLVLFFHSSPQTKTNKRAYFSMVF